jgi:ABC-type Fe3+-hydroxamate transport system substrate-binding protein
MVELAGATNAFSDVAASSAPVSIEAVASRAPRFVATVGTMSARLERRPEWRAVAAVRAHRVLSLLDAPLAHPTPRAPTAIAALRRLLDSASRAPTPKETFQ